MDKDYYKEYYTLERQHWWFKVRAKIILSLIDKSLHTNNNTNLQVLNAGAAIGKTSELLSKFGSVTSLEYDENCCAFAKETLNMDITQGDILALPYADNSFDIVCAFDVIEHVKDDVLAVAEMKRVCKIGGLVVVTVPAFMSLWSHHDDVNQHYRRYNTQNLLEVFSRNKLSKHKYTFYNTVLFLPIYLFRLITKIIPSQWIRKGAGSDATLTPINGILNKILYAIFSVELPLLEYIDFPFGVSIFVSAIKK